MMNDSGFSRRPLCALRYFEFAPRRPFALCTGGLLPVRLVGLPGGSIPRMRFVSVSPQFCHHTVQEYRPVVHRLRLSAWP